MSWTLHYYHSHRLNPLYYPPKTKEERELDGKFFLLCDAVCDCGYVQHPPKGGICPVCEADGELDCSEFIVH